MKYPNEISYLIGLGRIYDLLNDSVEAVKYYKKVLQMDSSNLEAVACIASYHFYIDQPEVSLRFYKRLI
jgi:tetratricopeptide repeat protein 8